MTDKVQKIREEIEKKLEVMQYQVHRKDAYKELKSILDYIDSLQEEPVSDELELTWEDIKDILNIYEEVIDMDFCEDIYGEVLKRFKDFKKRKIDN